MGVRHMTGIPWHLETLHSNGDRRNKRKCKYYQDDRCTYRQCSLESSPKCKGSAHCLHYLECENKQLMILPSLREKPITPHLRVRPHIPTVPDIHAVFCIGEDFLARVGPKKAIRDCTVVRITKNTVFLSIKDGSGNYVKQFLYPQIMRRICDKDARAVNQYNQGLYYIDRAKDGCYAKSDRCVHKISEMKTEQIKKEIAWLEETKDLLVKCYLPALKTELMRRQQNTEG